MMPSAADHAMAAALVVAFPLYASRSQRALERATAAGHPGARTRDYRLTMLVLWALVGLVLLIWRLAGRPGRLLGLSGGTAPALGAAAAALVLLALTLQWRAVTRLDDAGRGQLAAQLGALSELLPRTAHEYRTFCALAVTAGVCEEVLYRGFLIWYAATLVGVWPAVALAGVTFGLVHLYQGAAGALRASAVGLLLGALYAATGSLLWPVLIHVAVDLQGGAVGWAVRAARPKPLPA